MSGTASRDRLRAWLTGGLVLAFTLALAALFWLVVPTENRDMVTFMLGQLSGMAMSGVGYWLGTSKSSADKTEALAAIAANMPQDGQRGAVGADSDVSGTGLPEPAFGAGRGVSGQNSSEGN